MGPTQTRVLQVLLIVCLVNLIQGGYNCSITAFHSYRDTNLLLCSLVNAANKGTPIRTGGYGSPSHTMGRITDQYTWYFTDSLNNIASGSEINEVSVPPDDSIASFLNVSATDNTTMGYFVCVVTVGHMVIAKCSLYVTTKCDNESCCTIDRGLSTSEVKDVDKNAEEKKEIKANTQLTLQFIPVPAAIRNLSTCAYQIKAATVDASVSPVVPTSSTVVSTVSAVVPSVSTTVSTSVVPPGLEVTSTTVQPPVVTPLPPGKCKTFKGLTKENQSPCGSSSFNMGNNVTKTKLQLTNFLDKCQGVYIFSNTSGVVYSALFMVQEGDADDTDSSDESRWQWVFLPLFMAVAAAVVVFVVAKLRRRRLLHNSRHPIRHKMVSTISGSNVQIFNSMPHSKEEKSDLEEFPRKHIRFLDTIGKGTFGTVVMAEALNLLQKKKGPMSRNWATVAVKMTLISDKSNEELKSDFLCELALMKTIPPHVNIITLYASCTAHDPYLMILEYAVHGDLRKYLLEHRMERNYANAAFSAYGVKRERHYASAACAMYGSTNKKDKFEGNIYAVPGETRYTEFPSEEDNLITSRDLLSFALQICRGLEHLIRNRIVHRDVAARNVLLFDHRIVKISDFGLARKIGQGDVYERTRKGLLPIRWMSPESLFYNQFTEKSDVWSYGVLLWELITLGSTPYPGLDATTVLEKIRVRELLVCPPHSATVVNNIVNSCWGEDPDLRPTFVYLCQELEQLLEAEVEYVDLDQMNDHEYSTLDGLED